MEVFVQSRQWKIGAQTDALGTGMAEPLSDDREMLRQLKKGNEQVFSALYDRYQGPIYRFALHMSGNSGTAEEITQEVFMALITNPRGYDETKGTLAGYLFGIARNLTRRSLEQSRCLSPLADDATEAESNEPASDLDILADLSQAELVECLRKAVLALPEQYREIVVLCDLEEMSYDHAAALLNCSPGTVASRLHRARATLKARLKGQGCLR